MDEDGKTVGVECRVETVELSMQKMQKKRWITVRWKNLLSEILSYDSS